MKVPGVHRRKIVLSYNMFSKVIWCVKVKIYRKFFKPSIHTSNKKTDTFLFVLSSKNTHKSCHSAHQKFAFTRLK